MCIISGFQQKITRHAKRQKTQSEEAEQSSEPDSDAAEEFKTIMINMLTALMNKVENMQEQMGNESRGIEVLRKS